MLRTPVNQIRTIGRATQGVRLMDLEKPDRVVSIALVAKTEEVVATESDMRRALVSGMDPVEAYLKFGKF